MKICLAFNIQQEGLSPREYLEFTERERFIPEPPQEEVEGSGEEAPTYVSEPGEPGPRGPPGVGYVKSLSYTIEYVRS